MSLDGYEAIWDPLVAPDGAPGRYYAGLDHAQRDVLRRAVGDGLHRPQGAFRLTARACYAIGCARGRT